MRRPIPLTWYELHDALQAKANEKVSVMRRADVAALAPHLLDDQLEAALTLFHDLGMLIYFPDERLREMVTLDPQFLVDQISAVVVSSAADLSLASRAATFAAAFIAAVHQLPMTPPPSPDVTASPLCPCHDSATTRCIQRRATAERGRRSRPTGSR